MNNKKTIWRLLFVFAVTMMTFAVSSCSDDDEVSGGLELHYPAISDIGPSMTYTVSAPSYYGATPSKFAISKLKLEDAAVENTSFIIDVETGAVSIENTTELATGLYKLTITCVAGGGSYSFADILTVNMLAATPIEINVTPAVLDISLDGVEDSKLTAKVVAVDEAVSIRNYALVQDEGYEFFAISTTGVIGINSGYSKEFIPGTYSITIKLTTHAGEAIYADAMQILVSSAPLELIYTPISGKMEVSKAFTTLAPALKGSLEELAYTIKAITPATDEITINAQTGILSVAEGGELPIGGSYSIDITATNKYGTKDFIAAYELSVIAFIDPIVPATFGYADVEAVQAGSFTATKKDGFIGGETTYEFVELPAALANQVAIDTQTGTITANKGNAIALGVHNIRVKVSNVKGEAEATLKLTVVENPNFFTRITYGNNLGLPAGEHANQYRCAKEDAYLALNITPTTDVKSGIELTWSIAIKKNCAETTIDPITGVITPAGFLAKNGGLVMVTATAGAGTPEEVSVTTPVFFSFLEEKGAYVNHIPFVIQVNPREKTTSKAPVVTGVDDIGLFLLDYRRNFDYYNFNGPSTHLDGQPKVVGSFMNQMWTKYFKGLSDKATVNTGAKGPMSYYLNYEDYTGSLLAGSKSTDNALAYVEPGTYSVVINKDKWVDANNIAANGALFGQMTYDTKGNLLNISKGSQIFPVWIWFDEKF